MDTGPALRFLVKLAETLTRAGEPEGIVQPRITAAAAAYGVPDARVAVLPRLTLAATGPGTPVAFDATAPNEADLRLDQMAAVAAVARQADRGAVAPQDGLRALDDAEALPHRFGALGLVGGDATIALGTSLILQPTPMALFAALWLGALVGVMKLRASNATTRRVLLPVTSAALVSLLAFALAPATAADEALRMLIPPLVTFLPGAAITSGTLDLVVGHPISGASRLVAGSMQLVLLALGIALGAALAGVPGDAATSNTPVNSLGAWAPWLGVVVYGVGTFVHYSGPRGSLRWLLVVLLAAWVGEQLGAHLLSRELGAFVGAFVIAPVAAWAERHPSAPPALATIAPAVRLLVPGAVGLIGIAQFAGSNGSVGLGHLVTALAAVVLIALGVLVGQALVLNVRKRQA